jgi:hypothetical protein
MRYGNKLLLRKLFLICGIFILLGCNKTAAKPSETTTPEYSEAVTQDYSETQEIIDIDFNAYSKDPKEAIKEANEMLAYYLEKQDKTTSDISLISRNSENFTDYTPLLDFKYLKTLYIDNKLLTDINGITVLSQHEKLTELILWAKNVTDISPLSTLENLRLLSVDVANTHTDASELLSLTNLEKLIFTPTSSETILNISKLTWLKDLSLYLSNENIDISPVQNLKNLKCLKIVGPLRKENEYNISWINQLINLQELRLEGFIITDVNPLLKLPKLEVINVMWSEISDENIVLLKKTGAKVWTYADADR